MFSSVQIRINSQIKVIINNPLGPTVGIGVSNAAQGLNLPHSQMHSGRERAIFQPTFHAGPLEIVHVSWTPRRPIAPQVLRQLAWDMILQRMISSRALRHQTQTFAKARYCPRNSGCAAFSFRSATTFFCCNTISWEARTKEHITGQHFFAPGLGPVSDYGL